jgi:hypothetical protein
MQRFQSGHSPLGVLTTKSHFTKDVWTLLMFCTVLSLATAAFEISDSPGAGSGHTPLAPLPSAGVSSRKVLKTWLTPAPAGWIPGTMRVPVAVAVNNETPSLMV